MAKQNGPESTRYCGGCHDPISLFSGTKNIFVENLTGLQGYQEGVSCLACHAIQETDIQGNANYTITPAAEYLWQWQHETARRRSPAISSSAPTRPSITSFRKRIVQEARVLRRLPQAVHRPGGQPRRLGAAPEPVRQLGRQPLESRRATRAHRRVPRVPHAAGRFPATPPRGDAADYNRTPDDGKHRSHRFIAANTLVPKLLKLEGLAEAGRN